MFEVSLAYTDKSVETMTLADSGINDRLVQEAQLLLGDRATRKESMPRIAEMDVEMTT